MISTLSLEMDRQKVIAAIIAGVNAYIQGEETAEKAAADRGRLAAPMKLWALKGREEIMMMRMLWQRRMV
jgi:hypothetical protein